ncbi:MAG TPA: 50S ribosomal protein L29 [Candidatus Krumholzibacteria bacterium]|nr:50S ribosomal protein L29 [Candidatus Krumholzibacteria bacterium]
MKTFEMRDLSVEELEARIAEESENLMNMRIKLKGRTLDNPLNYRAARRELARMKTVLTEKQKEAESARD